jgi:O-antigen/teichoic acid export membrane protein
MMKRLFRDTLIYGGSAILSRGLSLIVLPIYTRILSPAEYGVLDMIFVIGSFATLLVVLEINQGLARFYADAETVEAKRRMASTILWFTVAAYTVAFGIAFAAAAPLAAWLLGSADLDGMLRIGLAGIATNGLFYLTQTQMRYGLMSTAFAVVSLFYSLATLSLGVFLGYGLGLGLVGVLWGQFAAAAAASAFGLAALRGSYSFVFDRRLLRRMLAFSLPLVPSALATFFTFYSNRLLLNDLEGLDAVGLFGVGARIGGAVVLLTIGLQSSLTPLIYAHYQDETTPGNLAQLTEWFIAAALLCCLGLGLYAWEILALFAEPRYAGAAPLVLFLAPATLLGQMYIFFPGIAISKRTKLQLYIFVTTAVATLLLNWLMIKATGLLGAAVATLAASLLFITLWVWTSQRLYPMPLRWRPIAAATALFVAAATGGLWVQGSRLDAAALLVAKGAIILLLAAGIVACRLVRVVDLIRLRRRLARGVGS